VTISRRNLLLAASTLVAAPAIVSRTGYAVEQKSIKIGSILTGTTMAGEIMIKYLKEIGVDAEILHFPNITQRMQALAADSIQVGYGGINAAISLAGRGVPLVVLSNACDGGWNLVGKSDIKDFAGLKGKKVGVQPGAICHIAIAWKLASAGLTKDVELVFLNNNDMPTPLQQGQIDAMFSIEPYPSLVKVNGWGGDIWNGYDTPMAKANLGFMASQAFVDKNPVLTRELVKAHVRATKDLIADPTIAAEVTTKVLNMPRNVIDLSLKNTFFAHASGEAFKKSVIAMGEMMVESKITEKLPNWDKFIDTSLVPA
jgi:NitT/TauT family transport system substrate-binding protein